MSDQHRDSYRAQYKEGATALLILIYGIIVLSLSPLLEVLGVGEKAVRPVCWAMGHRWADDEPYGVEPVCMACNKRRQA